MKLFELLSLKNNDVLPESSKVHLAVWNGEDNPLDVYFRESLKIGSRGNQKEILRETILFLSSNWQALIAGCLLAVITPSRVNTSKNIIALNIKQVK
ncbi:hypothetical protein [Vibrio splendidus]|uniref:hypothetical protein n=1 Tax=Vibrio splendidus TaxID=29497 RepID=UPI000808EE0D|nr:hypothetical protein [Vibrio splendidus]MDP2614261.1 hypothetical protein [Vibrio splendidus]SBS68388.1 hypothetical protein VHE8714_04306 [Vibrio splendidus]